MLSWDAQSKSRGPACQFIDLIDSLCDIIFGLEQISLGIMGGRKGRWPISDQLTTRERV